MPSEFGMVSFFDLAVWGRLKLNQRYCGARPQRWPRRQAAVPRWFSADRIAGRNSEIFSMPHELRFGAGAPFNECCGPFKAERSVLA